MVRSFKELIVWQKSFRLVKEVYTLTKELPREEQFGLTSQMRRAAVSIPSNIAEGSRRNSRKEYTQFLKMAEGSALELETQLLLVNDLYNITVTDAESLLTEIQKMLTTMTSKLNPKR